MAEAVPFFAASAGNRATLDELEARYAWVAGELYAREQAEAAQRAADYATSLAWADRLGPLEVIGVWRLPLTGPDQWQYYSHEQWYPVTYEQVREALQAGGAGPGTTPGFYHRALALSTFITDPRTGAAVPNPIFLIPASILPAWERPA